MLIFSRNDPSVIGINSCSAADSCVLASLSQLQHVTLLLFSLCLLLNTNY